METLRSIKLPWDCVIFEENECGRTLFACYFFGSCDVFIFCIYRIYHFCLNFMYTCCECVNITIMNGKTSQLANKERKIYF